MMRCAVFLIELLFLGAAVSLPCEVVARESDQPGPPPTGAPGYPSRAADLDALPGFKNPPPGYGEVPFWWWTGDPLDRRRLLWQIEELHKKGVSGMQVNYAHDDTPGWPTSPVVPEIFSKPWWDTWGYVAGECERRGMGIGLSGYTLDWPNGKSLLSRQIYSEREIQGRKLRVAQRVPAQAGKAVSIKLPSDTVGVWAYPLSKGKKITPPGRDLTRFVDTKANQLTWTPDKGDWEVWIFTAPRKPGTLNPI
ncbi:MAG: hypothetical protein JW818_05835, partial [Pirellulales bacterium]|nr:hypothetical protein [Pirellulales bacterium]